MGCRPTRHQPQIQSTSFARGSPPAISNPIAVTLSPITLAFPARHQCRRHCGPNQPATSHTTRCRRPNQPAASTSNTTRCGRCCGTTHCMVGANQLDHTRDRVQVVAVAQPTVWWGPTSLITHKTECRLLLWHNPLYGGDQPARSHTRRSVVAVAQPTVWWGPTSKITHETVCVSNNNKTTTVMVKRLRLFVRITSCEAIWGARIPCTKCTWKRRTSTSHTQLKIW